MDITMLLGKGWKVSNMSGYKGVLIFIVKISVTCPQAFLSHPLSDRQLLVLLADAS